MYDQVQSKNQNNNAKIIDFNSKNSCKFNLEPIDEA